MKKLIPLAILFVILAHNAFGQMLNVNKYAEYFVHPRRAEYADTYIFSANDDDLDRISLLGGNPEDIDTPLEMALLSICAGVINIRPPEANAILPANNPKLADTKLGAAVFREIQILRFLGDTAAVTRHESVLKFITDRGNATRAEIEAFYRINVRGLISEVVDGEFNKISFRLDWHNAVLIRNTQNGQYVLSYGGVNTNGETRTITANSLEALLAEMQNGSNKADFTSADLSTVRAEAGNMVAVVLSDTALNEVKNILTAFYTNPTSATYNNVKDVYSFYQKTYSSKGGIYAQAASMYVDALVSLDYELSRKVLADVQRDNMSFRSLSRQQQQRLEQVR